jgi:glycerophosphoryl diester phosphodiesterase
MPLNQAPQIRARSGGLPTIAHGGATDRWPANSLEGVSEVITGGADAIEVDVQLTRDGKPVLFHDSLLPGGGRIHELTYAKLAELRVAGQGGRVPLLSEVLEKLHDTGMQALLDIKDRDAIDAVMRVIGETNTKKHAWIASFDYWPLVRAKELDHNTPTILTLGISRIMHSLRGFLWTVFALVFPRRAATLMGADVILCPAWRLTSRLVKRAHRRQISVFVWDVKPGAAAQLGAYDIDAVVTDWTASTKSGDGASAT